MKTKEELLTLKQEYEALTNKLKELSEEELNEVTGGFDFVLPDDHRDYEYHLYTISDPNKKKAEFEEN